MTPAKPNQDGLKKPVRAKPLPKASMAAKPKSGPAGFVRAVRPAITRAGR